MNRLLDHHKMRKLVDNLIYVPPEMVAEMNSRARLSLKLDCLQQLIHQVRGAYGCFDLSPRRVWNPVTVGKHEGRPLLEFMPQRYEVRSLARNPDRLIIPLLQYLYRTEVAGLRVRIIIEAFLRYMGDELRSADFDFTASGSMRVVTRLRFTAHRMRKLGLLLDTPAERYRTWRLSLAGLLVAHWLEENPAPLIKCHESFIDGLTEAWKARPQTVVDALLNIPSLCLADGAFCSGFQGAFASWSHRLRGILQPQSRDSAGAPNLQLLRLFLDMATAPVAVELAQWHAGVEPIRPSRQG